MHADRLQLLNDHPANDKGRYLLYWMQQSQRAQGNPALEHAIRLADDAEVPVVVGFGLMADYPEANARHFAFMLQGLSETVTTLRERGIQTVIRKGEPHKVALTLAEEAVQVVCDAGYLRHQRHWRKALAKECPCTLIQVEGDLIVPVAAVTDKREYAARTLRPKVNRVRGDYLESLSEKDPQQASLKLSFDKTLDLSNPEKLLGTLSVDTSVTPSGLFEGGTTNARHRLEQFIRHRLQGYADRDPDPSEPGGSFLSPYLHFGQISPVEVVQKVLAAASGSDEDKEAFIEELLVRRELAINYVWFEPDYDRYTALPDWAQKTLKKHRDDERPQRYTRDELEQGQTEDDAWNAAMDEMRLTGFLANHMRMYWGKKIIEWCNTPEYAFETALYLNNKYFIDGRDPNSFTNIAWLFGLHDRPWKERPVFGTVRYMAQSGLKRKFDVDRYVAKIKEMRNKD